MSTFNSFLNSSQQSKNNKAFKQLMSTAPTSGVYLGRITSTQDVRKSGLLTVAISKLGQDDSTTSTEFYCKWSSPFAGTTDVGAVGNDLENFEQTQKSYGMWMIPPDVGNLVLVAFADNNLKMPFIIGCLFDNQYHHMVPGMPAGKSFGDSAMLAPVAEKNRKSAGPTHDDATRPIHVTMAETINRQGLINDAIRGAGRSGSRRESPSKVFGILTPGPRDPNNKRNRLAGHQFVMDDDPASRLIRLRTAGGSQLLLDDTTGTIYAINKLGTAWLELGTTGDVNLYADSSINMRTKGNFNLRADKNVNIEAGQNVNIKAAGDNIAGQYVGLPDFLGIALPALGTGGDVNIQANSNFNSLARGNQLITAGGGSIDMSSAGATRIRTGAQADDPTLGFFVKSVGGIQMDSDSIMQLNSTGQASFTSGGLVDIFGTITNINGPTGAALVAASTATSQARRLVMSSAPPIGLNSFEDNSKEPPKFDIDAAIKGETAFPTGGLRDKTPLPVQSIVSTMVTSEPYIGHAQYDPTEAAAAAAAGQASNDSLLDKLPPNAVGKSPAPADVVTKEDGLLAGTGYKDANGNPVSAGGTLGAQIDSATGQISAVTGTLGAQVDSVTGQISAVTGTLGAQVDSVTGQISGAANQLYDQALGGLGDSLGTDLSGLSPQYQQVLGAFNNFQSLLDVNLFSINGISQVINAIQSVIPFIPVPTTSPFQQKLIGYQKQLNEQMAQLEAFAVDAYGKAMSLYDEAMTTMRGAIDSALNSALDGANFDSLLAEAGIENIGSIDPTTGIKENIFKDKAGNLLVDISQGIGPVGASLGLVADINTAFEDVKGYVTTELGENQSLAIATFAQNVGTETFLNSNVLGAINEGKLDRVPKLMSGWTLVPENPGDPANTPSAYLADRRAYEISLFTTPDNAPLASTAELAPGEATFGVLAQRQEQAKREFVQELASRAENQGLDPVT